MQGFASTDSIPSSAALAEQAKLQHQQLQRLQPMPVSAVAAGKALKRENNMPHGSDIMADALAEEEVASTAQRFMAMQQQQQQRQP